MQMIRTNNHDKSTTDYEFEKSKDQCTFKPSILQKSPNPKVNAESSKDMSNIIGMKGALKSIERMQKGRERLDELKYF